MINLYHGSISRFEVIDIKSGKGYKDFGRGFYATAVISHAERLAVRNKNIAEKRQLLLAKKNKATLNAIVAYRYNLIYSENTEGLSVKFFDKADCEWLRFILKNRKSADSAHEYDIVIGPTADAETTAIINDYYDELVQSEYSEDVCRKVISRLKPENLPKQYFFRTEKALKTLAFCDIKRQVVE